MHYTGLSQVQQANAFESLSVLAVQRALSAAIFEESHCTHLDLTVARDVIGALPVATDPDAAIEPSSQVLRADAERAAANARRAERIDRTVKLAISGGTCTRSRRVPPRDKVFF